jgi:hypothetical protein
MLRNTAEYDVLTNEERSITIYKENNTPTDSSKVTAKTPLSELNLNWSEKDLPERNRTKHVHRLHPYLGKYIPQLVEIFLRKYFKPGQTVLDPFSGSGTTLVQAQELGINSVGFDISEFNVKLGEVKTADYNIPLLKTEIADILKQMEGNLFSGNVDVDKLVKESNDYLRQWFAPEALRQLLLFRHLLENYTYKDLYRIILSRSARSSRLVTHFDLDFPKKPQIDPYHCYKHSRMCQPTTESIQFLIRYSLDTVKRIEEFSKLKTKATVSVRHVDSRYGDPGQVDGIITSPPYVGLIDYHEQHTYAYNLLGLKDNSESEIGPAKKGSSIKAKEDYKAAMAQVFLNTSKHVKEKGKIIVVAGDRNNLYPEIGERANLRLDAKVERHVNRRTGRRSTPFFETVFIFTKK